VPEAPFSARAPWRTPRFQPRRKAERPCRPSPRASSRFPSVPPCASLKTCTLGSVSFHTLRLSLFSSSCPSLLFRPVRHGEPLVFSPDARPNGPAARRRVPPCRFPSVPPCPSPITYTLASVSFYTLGLSLFPRPWPNRCFRPARHGERLVFSPNARPNSHAARRRAPPCPSLRSSRASVSFSLNPQCPSPKTYTLCSVSFHTLGLSLFPGPCPSLRFRPVRHGRTPRFQSRRKAEQPCRPSPRASSRFPSVPPCPSLKPYIHLSFVVFPFHTLGLSLF